MPETRMQEGNTDSPFEEMLIDGQWISGTETREVLDPETGASVAIVPEANLAHVDRALDSATAAARAARSMPASERSSVLRRASQSIAADRERLARTIAQEGVKTITEAREEANRAATTIRIAAEEAERLPGETLRFDAFDRGAGRTGYWTRDPVGVIAAITPFNDPLNLVAHKVGPALAAGNSIVVKPHEETPLSALRLARALTEAGLPAGMLQVLTGSGSTVGAALVKDERVHMISFTGGRATGARIARAAGTKKLLMELGGNATTIVLEDADLSEAAQSIVAGAFSAAGQNCLHVQRLLIHRSVYRDLRELLVQKVEEIQLGPKLDERTDMGPLINTAAAERVMTQIEGARSRAARVLIGGTSDGVYVTPTLMEAVPADHFLARKEIFGPVTSLWEFDNLDEAIDIANSGDHGLHCGIFTESIDAALNAIRKIETAGVMVNDSSDFRIDSMPFGGRHGSGIGREGVRYAAEAMSEPKTVCFNLRAPIAEQP